MKIVIALVAFVFAAGSAMAADQEKKAPSPAQQAQQEKMKSCNADAGKKELKGDERKKFMSECLKAPGAPAAAPAAELAPKDAMKACSAAGKGKKGDDYKKFMSDCLKAKGPANMK